MDGSTMEKHDDDDEEQEKEKGIQQIDLYLNLISKTLKDSYSVWYKIDPKEPNFGKDPELISREKSPIGCGSAICGSILYLFGGGKNGHSMNTYYLDLSLPTSMLELLDVQMQTKRSHPKTLTIDEKIFIFGSDVYRIAEDPSRWRGEPWGEVFNTQLKTFKPLNPPPKELFRSSGLTLGVFAVIGGRNQILIASSELTDLFLFDVGNETWEHKKTNIIESPFYIYSIRSPVIDDNFLFLYGSGKVCVFDIDKNKFLKNDVDLLEYSLFNNSPGSIDAVIHYLGNWMFCVVFSEYSYLVTHLHAVSFRIDIFVDCDGESNIKARNIQAADYVLNGWRFVDSVALLSKQIVPSGNRLRKNNEGGWSSVVASSRVDDGMILDYGTATSKLGGGNDQDLCKDAMFSKLCRKTVALEKERVVQKLDNKFWMNELARMKGTLSESLLNDKFFMKELTRVEEKISEMIMEDDDIIPKSDDDLEICFEDKDAYILRLRRKVKALETEITELYLEAQPVRNLKIKMPTF